MARRAHRHPKLHHRQSSMPSSPWTAPLRAHREEVDGAKGASHDDALDDELGGVDLPVLTAPPQRRQLL